MSKHQEEVSKPIRIKHLKQKKERGEKISVITAYDYTFASIINTTQMHVVLVGDSAANIMAGHNTTLPITLDQMIYHAQSVGRAINKALIVVDLPFGSYQASTEKALESAIRVMKEARVHAVKIEGGRERAEIASRITQAGIPVMGHLGLLPQAVHQLGGYCLQARQQQQAELLLEDAKILEEAGCFSVVLEKIPSILAQEVTKSIEIPTIGIGAGPHCDGQVLVLHDMLGFNPDFQPKFLRYYANLFEVTQSALNQYIDDVKMEKFPNEEESY